MGSGNKAQLVFNLSTRLGEWLASRLDFYTPGVDDTDLIGVWVTLSVSPCHRKVIHRMSRQIHKLYSLSESVQLLLGCEINLHIFLFNYFDVTNDCNYPSPQEVSKHKLRIMLLWDVMLFHLVI